MAMVIPGAVAQAAEEGEGVGEQPGMEYEGVPVSHASYKLEAFDCDEPQDVITRSIPSNCNPEVGKELEEDDGGEPLEDYTILQKTLTFEYKATLCSLRRSRQYFNCVHSSHIRLAAPPKIYVQETLGVDECRHASNSGIFADRTT